MKIFKYIFLGLIFIQGCATVSGSGNQSVSVLIVDENKRGILDADCKIVNNRGAWNFKAPATVTISRSSDPLKVTCLKDGYTSGESVFKSDIKGGAFGNIIVGGGIGALVDHGTGAGYEYPKLIQIQLRSNGIITDSVAQNRIQNNILEKNTKDQEILKLKSNDVYVMVIGNGAYIEGARLANPINDAKAIATIFKSFGFVVSENYDASRERLVRSLIEFGRASKNAKISILFYAGHGVQVSGSNYLLPIDLNLRDLSQIPLMGIPVDALLEQYMNGAARIVFLDACRDNPFYLASTRNMSRGLAPINATEGTLISYATKDGQVAQDGDGSNSPFTKALLEHIGDGDDIAVILRKVREKVIRTTNGKQVPWEYGSLTGGALVLSRIGKE